MMAPLVSASSALFFYFERRIVLRDSMAFRRWGLESEPKDSIINAVRYSYGHAKYRQFRSDFS